MAPPPFRVNLHVVCIAQVDMSTALLGDACSQGHLDAGRFNPAGCIICTRSLDMRAVGENAARHIFEAIPLFEKIIPHVVTYLVDQLPMRVGYLGNLWRVDDDLTSVSNSRRGFVHRLCSGPHIVIDRCRHREYAFERPGYRDDIDPGREIGRQDQYHHGTPAFQTRTLYDGNDL